MIVLFFAVLVESIIEYVCGNIQILRPYLPLLSLALAIFIIFAYQLSIPLLLGLQTGAPFIDFLFSSFVVARLSNFINDGAQKFLGSK